MRALLARMSSATECCSSDSSRLARRSAVSPEVRKPFILYCCMTDCSDVSSLSVVVAAIICNKQRYNYFAFYQCTVFVFLPPYVVQQLLGGLVALGLDFLKLTVKI